MKFQTRPSKKAAAAATLLLLQLRHLYLSSLDWSGGRVTRPYSPTGLHARLLASLQLHERGLEVGARFNSLFAACSAGSAAAAARQKYAFADQTFPLYPRCRRNSLQPSQQQPIDRTVPPSHLTDHSRSALPPLPVQLKQLTSSTHCTRLLTRTLSPTSYSPTRPGLRPLLGSLAVVVHKTLKKSLSRRPTSQGH